MQEIKKPIFIIGTGRCGSTIFHQVFSHHPYVAWLSQWCEAKPHNLEANRWAMRVLDLPLPSRYLRKLVYPVEAYTLWDYYCPGFKEPCRDLLREDVTPRVKKAVRNVMAQMLTQKRHRLLIKITGWPRISFLREIFPDAKFIHVYRDGRAVVNSWIATRWWNGWQGPQNWRWGELSAEQQTRWLATDRSFVALAGLGWEILMDAHQSARKTIPTGDFMEVRYEDLCLNPLETFQQAINFCGLGWTSNFEVTIQNFSFKNTNHKWREYLSEEQQNMLNQCISGTLKKYGYN